ncbi:MAG: glycosyltransferase family 2 protein [Bacteroidaceae bacterium]
MNNPAVSILVPVYRVEKYLARCLDSVLAQDFADWEMVLVDDGSPDRCPQICDEYAARDARIRVVHKENGGLVSARLAGFREARAEYLMFVDSDDWLMPSAVGVLYRKIQEGFDIVKGRNLRVSPSGQVYGMEETAFYQGVLERDAYLRAYIQGKVAPYLWGGIYRKSLFAPEIFERFLFVSRQEDWVTQLSIGLRVRRVCYVDEVVQAYVINEASIMQTCVTDYSYVVRIGEELQKVAVHADEEIKYLLVCDRMKELNRCFFFPELPFAWKHYHVLRSFFQRKENRVKMKGWIDPKFLRFIQRPWLFYLYTRLYGLLFRYVRLKGHIRRVLK